MASTYYSDNYGVPMPSHPAVGVQLIREFLFTVASAFVINDLVYFCRINGSGTPLVIDDFFIDVPDLDTHSTPTIALSIGDPDTPGKFVAIQTTVGQAAGKLGMDDDGVAAALPVSYSTNSNFIMKVTTAPATGATGVTIKGWLAYHYIGAPTVV